MTKRDTLTYLLLHLSDDDSGGATVDSIEEIAIIPAHVSVNSTANEITMFGVTTQYVLHVVTDKKLSENSLARYGWSGKMFKLMRQIKAGNEYFSTLLEVSE